MHSVSFRDADLSRQAKATPDSSSTSSSFVKDSSRHQAKRHRKALSCTQCKERKIKCDRLVPHCGSCVVRGIERTCQWGDERDEDVRRGTVKSDHHKREAEPQSDQVDSIVDAVLKRLKKDTVPDVRSASSNATRAQSEQEIITNSIYECVFERTKRPPPFSRANVIPVTAFRGAPVFHALRAPSKSIDEQLDASLILPSLQWLPNKAGFDALVELYLTEMEPRKLLFNHVILREQLYEFWQGVEELHASPGSFDIAKATPTTSSVIDLSYQAYRAVDAATDATQDFFLCSRVRQGLIAVVFAILDATARALDGAKLRSLQVVADFFSDEQASTWTDMIHELSMRHLTMSNHLQQPTLWSLQTLLLSHSRWLDARPGGRTLGVISVVASLSANLGLNRLGSAYDDLERMDEETESHTVVGEAASAREGNLQNLLTDTRYSISLATFEEGNLAMRELGRKIWCHLLAMDWTMASHLDHFYVCHDLINHTSPPAPIDDDDILSAKAPLLLAKAQVGRHKPSENAVIGIMLALARAARTQTDLENVKGLPLGYADVLIVDEGIKEVIEMVPEALQFHTLDAKEKSNLSSTSRAPYFARQAVILHDQIHFRRLRLHRMHFGKGLKDARFRSSVLACLHSARVILAARTYFEQGKLMVGNSYVMQGHLLHAALVFQLVLLYEMDRQRALHCENGKLLANSSKQMVDDEDVYVLDDFDATLEQMEGAVSILKKNMKPVYTNDLTLGLESFLQGVRKHRTRQKEATSASAKSRTRARRAKPDPRTANTLSHKPHTDAASILASAPSLMLDRSPQNPSPSNSTSGQSHTTQSTTNSSSSPNLTWPTIARDHSHTLPFFPDAGQVDRHNLFGMSDMATGQGSTTTATEASAQASAGMSFENYNSDIWSLEALFPDYAAGEVDLIEALERSFGNNGALASSDSSAQMPSASNAQSMPPPASHLPAQQLSQTDWLPNRTS